MAGFCLTGDAIDRLMPMNLRLSATGHITHRGPTLARLDPGGEWIGQRFFEMFTVRRPGGVRGLADMTRIAGQRLSIAHRNGAVPPLRGLALPMADGQGFLLNLSFGVGVLDAVRRHRLTEADFAPTDLAVELLYLVEVKTALVEDLHQMNRRLRGAKSLAEAEAQTDTLTGLRNRRALNAALAAQIASGQPFAVMHLDLDLFKSINDTLGHAAGDFVLREVANVLWTETRQGDTVARVGGDEFVVILPELTSVEKLEAVAERIIKGIARPMTYEGQSCQVSVSIGMTVSDFYAQPAAAEMLADADMALYVSKHGGRGMARMFRNSLATRAAG